MKRNVIWLVGLSTLVMALMVTVVFSSITSANAQVNNGYGPGGRWAQTTPGSSTGQPGSGCCVNAAGQMGVGPGARMGQGMGMMNDYGRGGGMRGPGYGAGARVPVATGPLSEETKQFLTEAIGDEYQNRALYQAVVDKFGQILPFANIVRSESAHIAALSRLFTNHGLSVPADTYAGKVAAPATQAEAFQAAIQAEKDNAAMYDRFLKTVKEQDVTLVFTHLGAASTNMHLVAFQYYNK